MNALKTMALICGGCVTIWVVAITTVFVINLISFIGNRDEY